MNRLQKKCVIAAVGAHLLLVVIMIVGPAFLSSHSDADDTQVIDFIPANLIDKPFSGGGEKNPTPAATPNPTPQQTATVTTPQPKAEVTPPAPVPKPTEQPKPVQPVAQKEPPKTTPTPPKRDPDSLDPKPAKAKPNISTTIVTRKPSSTTTTKSTDDTATAAAAAAKQRASDIAKATRNLRNGLSSSTAVETPAGFGGGGEAYASYGLVVKSIYENAWIEPSDASADNATASVTVTIGNDGTVISAQLTTPSGDERTDASIQRALDRVKYIAPFPASMTEKQHTYIIDFNLKAKRSTA